MKLTLSNGETLSYIKRPGGERIVVLIHGNMAASTQWDILIKQLDDEFTIYAIDLRGYGDSTYNHPIETMKDFSDDIKLFIDHLGIERFDLIGWSNGGGVALQFSADYPKHVSHLVLLASMSTRGYPAFDQAGNRADQKEDLTKNVGLSMMIEAQQAEDHTFFRNAMDQLLYADHQPSKEQYQCYLISATQQQNFIDVAHAANLFNVSAQSNGLIDGNEAVKKIKAPVLVVWGVKDQLTSKAMTLELIEDLVAANIRLSYLPVNAGHALFVDDAQAILHELHQFLKVN
ncbi:Pimeloyl-ACP methyl ester carboxylesterase [Amphibacillus marinus]|uniref:Pimeloyl-ACP methyl ester carboxylesterase n=1 Tax=Amphibacillus marinus TaxID=872970 RepID=A0A1H8KJA0_9BACI|nr:alpha/beta hydrolase [Amphibacillus marinus]SEN92964.1 Pimeloyl-ACP methyl ester carboxylesterase [Amphibacillus marinus]